MSMRLLSTAVKVFAIFLALSAADRCMAEAELPPVIPYPHAMQVVSRQQVVLGEGGLILAKTALLEKGCLYEEASDLIERTLAERKLTKGSRPPAVNIVLASLAAVAKAGGPQNVPAWTPQELAALCRSDQAYVIRVQPGDHAKVWVVGASPLGTYYGADNARAIDDFGGAGQGRAARR